jgi:hypothetical protein
MNMLRRALVPAFALGALAAACESGLVTDLVPPDAVALQMQPVADEVAQYLYSGVRDRRRLFIKDVGSWTTLWEEVTAPYEPPPPVPAIDFGSEAVVVASMGTRPTGGYSITIEGVYEDDGELYVVVRERAPGSNCVVTQAITAPVHAVRVPQRSGTVRFVEHTETQNCQ